MKAKRENKVYSITTEQEKQRYLKEGYDIYTDDGKLLEYSPLKKISYSQYEALRKENDTLREKIAALEGESSIPQIKLEPADVGTDGIVQDKPEAEQGGKAPKTPVKRLVADMGYVAYVDPEYYRKIYSGTIVPEESLEKALRQASRHIDSLTYNRIQAQGFENLTGFQQEIIRETVCQQADFEYENADEINTVLSGYSINGVSAQFGSSWNVFMDKGIAMKKDVYSILSQTGLCCRLAR